MGCEAGSGDRRQRVARAVEKCGHYAPCCRVGHSATRHNLLTFRF
jgi:hypothetical protein